MLYHQPHLESHGWYVSDFTWLENGRHYGNYLPFPKIGKGGKSIDKGGNQEREAISEGGKFVKGGNEIAALYTVFTSLACILPYFFGYETEFFLCPRRNCRWHKKIEPSVRLSVRPSVCPLQMCLSDIS